MASMEAPTSPEHPLARRAALACGIASALFYVIANVAGALRWHGYSFVTQAVSELSAIDAPSRAIVLPLFLVYDLLLIVFAYGVWKSAPAWGALRVTAGMLLLLGAVGLLAPVTAMHMRGSPPTITDSMHIGLTVASVVVIVVAVASSARAFGRGFRAYAIATIALMLVFGVLAAEEGPRLAAHLATPWLGVTERINIGAYLVWQVALAIMLLRAPDRGPGVVDARRSGRPTWREDATRLAR